jgi:hypothetical protein
MTQRSPPRRRRALIVDDETSFGISLEETCMRSATRYAI